jgi:Protein of unknown function (DUF1501)
VVCRQPCPCRLVCIHLGFDHERFTFAHAGRDYRLTEVHGRVVHQLLA